MADKVGNEKENIKEDITRRSLFYAICLFALLQFILIPLQRYSYFIFWLIGLSGFLVVLLELFYSRVSDKPLKLKMKFVKKRVWRKHFLRHLVLPSLLYFSSILFLFFNRIKLLDQVSIIIVTASFWVLFHNISMTYMKAYRTSKKTRYIFDVIRIIIFYFVTNVIVNAVYYYGFDRLIIYLGVGALSFVLVSMMISIFNQFSPRIWFVNALSACLMGFGAWLIVYLAVFNMAIIALVITVLFYLNVVFWHHKLEGTFNWDAMTQYILFAIMAVILLLYI
jgi:hypothetical protein